MCVALTEKTASNTFNFTEFKYEYWIVYVDFDFKLSVCHFVEMHRENCGEYEYEHNKSNAYANCNKYFIQKGTLHNSVQVRRTGIHCFLLFSKLAFEWIDQSREQRAYNFGEKLSI